MTERNSPKSIDFGILMHIAAEGEVELWDVEKLGRLVKFWDVC